MCSVCVCVCVAATEVLRGVTWSQSLDDVFADNYRRDPTLSWQYFGSSSGFFRNYPGTCTGWTRKKAEPQTHDHNSVQS